MLRDVERQSGLTHRRPRGDDDQLARVKTCRFLIELEKRRRKPLDALAGIEKRPDAPGELLNDLSWI